MKPIHKRGIHAVPLGSKIHLTFKASSRMWIAIELDFDNESAIARRLDSPKEAAKFTAIVGRGRKKEFASESNI
jgi:hypothetical protein